MPCPALKRAIRGDASSMPNRHRQVALPSEPCMSQLLAHEAGAYLSMPLSSASALGRNQAFRRTPATADPSEPHTQSTHLGLPLTGWAISTTTDSASAEHLSAECVKKGAHLKQEPTRHRSTAKRVVMCGSKWLSPPVQWWIMAIISLTCFSSSWGHTLPSRNLHCMA